MAVTGPSTAAATAAAPASAWPHYVKGQLLRAQGRCDDAIPEYEAAIYDDLTWTWPDWEAPVEAVGRDGAATFRGFRLSFDDRVRGTVIGNLLCHGVVVFGEIEAAFGIDFRSYFAAALEGLAGCVADGLVEISRTEIRATPLGRVFLRNLAMPFDAYLASQMEKPVFSRTL